jgi:SAM-dependent methyltransferase
MEDVAKWDENYRTGHTPWDTGSPSSELMRVVREERIEPCRAIDLGCGTGTNAVWLAQQGFEVTGADLSSLAVDRSRSRAAAAGVRVRFLTADLLRPPALGGPFSFFFDRGCYHVLRRTDVNGYLRTLEDAIQPDARGLILAGNAREPHDPGPPVVTEDEMRSELGRLFDIIWLREFRFDQVEEVGVRFLGWSCFVRR